MAEHAAEGMMIKTLNDAVDFYISNHCLPNRAQPSRSLKPILAAIGTKPVEKINYDLIDAYTKKRMKKVASPTVRREIVAAQAALNFCVRRGRIAMNRFSLPMPPDSQPRLRWLTEDEERRLIDALQDERLDVQIFARMGLTYGVRAGAMLELDWSRVDFAAGMIDFRKPNVRETRKKRPVVPMIDTIRALLEQKPLRHGRVLAPQTAVHFRRFTDRIGMGDVTPHVLKHTAITLSFRAGVRMETIARLTRTDIRTLDRHYRHHSIDELVAAAERRPV